MYTPLNPFYIEKMGVAGVCLFFYFCSMRRFRKLRVPTIYVLSKNKKNIKIFLLKFFSSYNFEKICISHEHVFIMGKERSCLPWARKCLGKDNFLIPCRNPLDVPEYRSYLPRSEGRQVEAA